MELYRVYVVPLQQIGNLKREINRAIGKHLRVRLIGNDGNFSFEF